MGDDYMTGSGSGLDDSYADYGTDYATDDAIWNAGDPVDYGTGVDITDQDLTDLLAQPITINPDGTIGSGNFSFQDVLQGIQRLMSGTSSLGRAGQVLAAGGLGQLLNNMMGGNKPTGPAGYKGGIPEYTATFTQTPIEQQRPVRYEAIQPKEGEAGATVMRPVPYRPGQGGITYFNPIQYTSTGRDLTAPVYPAAAPAPAPAPASTPAPRLEDDPSRASPGAASGGYMNQGIAMLARGGSPTGSRFLRGDGDGTSDSINAKFAESGQPARLADGEFVIDARTVSEIGNGSSEAGARKLYEMMDRVHKARRAAERGKPSGADKFLPK